MSRIYLKKTATGLGDGSSWDNAFTVLDDAINLARISGGYIYGDTDTYSLTSATIDNEVYIEFGYMNGYKTKFKSILTADPLQIHSSGRLSIIDANMNISGFLGHIYLGGILTVQDSEVTSNYLTVNSGTINLNNVKCLGDAGRFIENYNTVNITDVNSYGHQIFIEGNNYINIDNSNIHAELYPILNSPLSSNMYVDISNTSLTSGTDYSIVIQQSSYVDMNMYKTNMISQFGMYIGSTASGIVNIDRCIFNSGGIVNANLVEVNIDKTNIIDLPPSGVFTNITTTTPQFFNKDSLDYRLLIADGVNGVDTTSIIYDQYVKTAPQGLKFTSNVINNYLDYTYKFNNNITFSDYMKERFLANKIHNIDSLSYEFNFVRSTELYNRVTKSAFPEEGEQWPWEWDYQVIDTPNVETKKYIIPKSVINITEDIENVFGSTYSDINISNLKVQVKQDVDNRGVTYDYYNSTHNAIALWTVTGDQKLIHKDIYTGEEVATYPLLLKNRPSGIFLIQPSGIIPLGKHEDGYEFALESDPNITMISSTDDGRFEWLPTEINGQYDVRGILAYKNDLFITATYTNTGDSPVLLQYPCKGTFNDYICDNPKTMLLNQYNTNPTDISVNEKGEFLIGDRGVTASGVYIYKYQPKYDYSMNIYTNVTDTKLLLREQYADVQVNQEAPVPVIPLP